MTEDEFKSLKTGDKIYHHDQGIADGAPLIIICADPINNIFTCIQTVTASNPEEWTKIP